MPGTRGESGHRGCADRGSMAGRHRMRYKLALTIALGILAGTVTGGALAGAQVNLDPSQVTVPTLPTVTVPTTPTLPTTPTVPTTPLPTSPTEPAPAPAPSGGTGGGGGGGGSGGGGGGGGGNVGGNTQAGSGGVVQHNTITGPRQKNQKKNGSGGVKAPGKGKHMPGKPPPPYTANGPTVSNPTTTVGLFGPAPIGVPNFVIDSFEIPPFLLPIYQACGTEYGIPWQVLASINKIETAFGTNLNISSAGAMGWMQFIPSTWAAYGVDANADGRKDPYNPVDAICAAARYLRAAGGDKDLRQSIFAYNHADWYVDEVLLGANQYGKLPDALVGSLTGLTEGAHFPVAADAKYADDINDAAALTRSTTQRRAAGNAADVIASNAERRSINIYSSLNAPVVAVNDGVIKKMGDSKELGKFIVLQDAYGNRYTYAQLGSIEKVHPVARQDSLSAKDFKLSTPGKDAAPTEAASAGDNSKTKSAATPKRSRAASAPQNTEDL